MIKIVIVDYGMGDLRSVAQALMAITPEADACTSAQVDEIRTVDRVVLSGRGAMPDCMAAFDQSGLCDAAFEASRSKPVLGARADEQVLLKRSTEVHSGWQYTEGLGLIKDDVAHFDLDGKSQPDGSRYKVPQMGWNRMHQSRAHALWEGVPDQSYFYFVHSYYMRLMNADGSVGETEYGVRFTSATARDNTFATQFHPEKSAQAGLQIYRNLVHWNP